MIQRQIKNFDLAQICDSGQCFRISMTEDGLYRVCADNRCLTVSQSGNQFEFYCSLEDFQDFWEKYFDLEKDYRSYIEKINPRDAYLVNAAQFGSGIRILRQDLWEMLVSFLISQQNHIGRIRRCIENLCRTYGEKKIDSIGRDYYTFPKAEDLAHLEEDELKSCNLGYRSKYVVRSARSVVSGEISLERIREMPYGKARKELVKFYGVGEKVADCICLFALHQLDAFPIDTHIRQALDSHYRRGFPNRRYRGFRGVMQQYIFYYELKGRYAEPPR